MGEMSKEWIVGFIEGEGNFNVSLSKNFKTKTWTCPFEYYPILQFRIFLREDDLKVLQKIKKTLEMGKIYKKSMEYNRNKGINARDQYVYYITSSKDLNKFKEILQKHEFHSKKKKDAENFFKILDLKMAKKHNTLEGNQEILSLATDMNSQNRKNFQLNPSPNNS